MQVGLDRTPENKVLSVGRLAIFVSEFALFMAVIFDLIIKGSVASMREWYGTTWLSVKGVNRVHVEWALAYKAGVERHFYHRACPFSGHH